MVWDANRRLEVIYYGASRILYAYNDQGIRTLKSTPDGITYYQVEGSRILSETTDGNIIIYLYDADGSPMGMKYLPKNTFLESSKTYYFEKNIQGDIVAIYDSMGYMVASYVYDAWGNFEATYYNSGTYDEVVQKNPFLYRGYYYDYETGFYYLNSRYYDPEVGRFINADVYISTGQGILGNNMYAYCGNNPVMNVDPNGDSFVCLLFTISAICYTTYCYIVVSNYRNNSELDADSSTSTQDVIINYQGADNISQFKYGIDSATNNGCETIAIHNARILLGESSNLSTTMWNVQSQGGMWALGIFGTKPWDIGGVLDQYGMSYTEVGLDELNKPGTYIISYWNGTPWLSSLHTIAVQYDGTEYTAYNKGGNPSANPTTYANNFICGYYLE